MIPVLVGEERGEARRIQSGLAAAGIAVQIVEEFGGRSQPDNGIALVHFSRVAHLNRPQELSSLIAFGGADRAEVAVRTMQQGATEYLPEGADIGLISAAIQHGAVPLLTQNDAAIASSERMRQLLELSTRVAQADISVLISGESGTGKEVVARHIHQVSNRAEGPFVAVNCAAIPETMLEAVLFGHDKGAFTGATEKRLGKFELADKGTLLLDEITEMPVALQAKLLRVLQEREVERIGSNRPKQIDVRVLATSNRQLKEAVALGQLREDLYYRLSVFPLVIPPLRERIEDVIPLAEHFLTKHALKGLPRLSEQARAKLVQYTWPGNVRELENCMQRAIVLCSGQSIAAEDLGLELSEGVPVAETDSLQGHLRGKQDQVLLRALDDNQGKRKATALQLGISERTLRYKLKELRDRGILA